MTVQTRPFDVSRSSAASSLARGLFRPRRRLLEKLDAPAVRLWYARQATRHGWSHNVLKLQIQSRAHERQGKAVTKLKAALPPTDSDMTEQVFKDPYLFDFLGTADPRRERKVEQALVDRLQSFLLDRPTLGLLLCRSKDKLVVEYALRGLKCPIGVADWETKLVDKLPKEMKGSLPTVEEIEAELAEEVENP